MSPAHVVKLKGGKRALKQAVKLWCVLLLTLALLTGCAPEPEILHDPERIVIALLDSGVCADAIGSDHLLPGWNYVTDTEDTEDLLNHGTAVASAILGSASAEVTGAAGDAYLIPLVVVSQVEGETTGVPPETLARAIRESIDLYHADIICVSLGILKEGTALLEAVRIDNRKSPALLSFFDSLSTGAGSAPVQTV